MYNKFSDKYLLYYKIKRTIYKTYSFSQISSLYFKAKGSS